MSSNNIVNKTVLDIELTRNNYFITVPLKNTYFMDKEEYYFTLEERYTNDLLYLSSSIRETLNDFTIFQIIIPFDKNKDIFKSNNIWDTYINRKDEDGTIHKHRINSNYNYIRF